MSAYRLFHLSKNYNGRVINLATDMFVWIRSKILVQSVHYHVACLSCQIRGSWRITEFIAHVTSQPVRQGGLQGPTD